MGWAEKFSSFFSYVTWYSLLNLFNLREPHFTFWTVIHLLTCFLSKSNIFVYLSNFCLGLRVCLWISKSVAGSLILTWNVYYIISFFTHWKFDSNMQWSFLLKKEKHNLISDTVTKINVEKSFFHYILLTYFYF